MSSRDEILEVLSCEIERRPAGAPGPDDLARWLRGIERSEDGLIFEFCAEGLAEVSAFAQAEQECCGGLGWEVVEDGDAVRLRVTGTATRLDALAGLWREG